MQEPAFRVGEWLVTPADNTISRDGRLKTLEPRLIDMLCYFARHPDVVLSRDELIDNVWKRNIVTNHVVTQCISELRKYLKDGDSDSPEYIITVPKRGYKLATSVIWCEEGETQPAPAPAPQIAVIMHEPEDGSEEDETPYVPPRRASAPVAAPGEKKPRFYRRSTFWVWLAFLAALSVCVAFVGIATLSQRVPVSTMPVLLNPRDIDIRIQGGELQQLDAAALLCGGRQRADHRFAEHLLDLPGARPDQLQLFRPQQLGQVAVYRVCQSAPLPRPAVFPVRAAGG